jgi:hypothetical protein
MKSKVALAEESGRPRHAGHDRRRGNPHGWQSVPPAWSHPREELRQDQCAYCHQQGHWKNEGPQWPRDPQKAPSPQPEAEAELLKENISLLRGEAALGKKTSSGWPLLRSVRTRADLAPIYWAPRSLWSK